HCGGCAFAAYIADKNPLAIMRQQTASVEIAAHFPCRKECNVDAAARHGVEDRGSEHGLHPLGGLHLSRENGPLLRSLLLLAEKQEEKCNDEAKHGDGFGVGDCAAPARLEIGYAWDVR